MQKILKLNLLEMIQVLLPTQHTIIFYSKWLDNSGYIITLWRKLVEEQAFALFKKLRRTKKVIKVGKISGNMTA